MTVADLKRGLRKFPQASLQARVDMPVLPHGHAPASQMIVTVTRPQRP